MPAQKLSPKVNPEVSQKQSRRSPKTVPEVPKNSPGGPQKQSRGFPKTVPSSGIGRAKTQILVGERQSRRNPVSVPEVSRFSPGGFHFQSRRASSRKPGIGSQSLRTRDWSFLRSGLQSPIRSQWRFAACCSLLFSFCELQRMLFEWLLPRHASGLGQSCNKPMAVLTHKGH